MLNNQSYQLFGFLELVPVDTGFVTAVFEYHDEYYIQIEGEHKEVNHFEKIPASHKSIIRPIHTHDEKYQTSGSDCLYGFKNEEEIVILPYAALVSYLQEQLLSKYFTVNTISTIESFLQEHFTDSCAAEPELVFENMELISFQHKTIVRKPPSSIPLYRKWDLEIQDIVFPKGSLCAPLNSRGFPSMLFSKRYDQLFIQQSGIKECLFNIAIRTIDLEKDIPIIYDWLPWEYKNIIARESHLNQLYDLYDLTCASTNAQSYMILLNHLPVAQLDVVKAQGDDIGLCYNATKGDFRVSLLIPAQKSLVPDLNRFIVRVALEFIFSFPEVTRIVMDAAVDDIIMNEILQGSGFLPENQVDKRKKVFTIYTCTYQGFLQSIL